MLNLKLNQNILIHLKKVCFYLRRIFDFLKFLLVFGSEYYSNITMSLNQTRLVPNSTELNNVWWEMRENRTGFKVAPSCEFKQNKNFILIDYF